MSFMNRLGEYAGKAVKYTKDEIDNKKERFEHYEKYYEHCDDDKIIKKYKTSSGIEKIVCAKLLKERGYELNSI